jgi:hypothetical protein
LARVGADNEVEVTNLETGANEMSNRDVERARECLELIKEIAERGAAGTNRRTEPGF